MPTSGVRLFVTGFGPFGNVTENPSAKLAENSGVPYSILEVSFQALDEALEELPEFDALLMIGVAGNTYRMRLECVGHNRIGKTPDVRGTIAGPGPIDPAASSQLHGSLWTTTTETEIRHVTVDAGDYLCNYALFRALQKFPDKSVGFLHVPPFERLPFEVQLAELKGMIADLQAS